MKVTPTGHILSSFAHRGGMGWRKAIFEWIDNALGAKATSISIEICKSYALVRDNGEGSAAMRAFATLGEHVDHARPDAPRCPHCASMLIQRRPFGEPDFVELLCSACEWRTLSVRAQTLRAPAESEAA